MDVGAALPSRLNSAIADLTALQLAAGVAIGAVVIILAALGFEHIGGYAPCPLCLEQRTPYYFGIIAAIASAVVLAASPSKLRMLAAALLAAATLGFVYNAGLGAYHAGVEWGFWAGPATCAGDLQPLATSAGGLLAAIEQDTVIRCDEPSWRFLGLSFAGYNVLISLALAAMAGLATMRACAARRH